MPFFESLRMLVCAALCAVPLAAAAQSHPPKDVGANDPAFAAFRTELRRVAAEHDLDALLGLITANAVFSFGGHEGVEGARELASRPEFWKELQRVLATASGSDGENAYVAPYWHRLPDYPDFDPYESFFVNGADVPLRAAPDHESEIVARLSHQVVRWPPPYEESDFARVELADGREGYVERDEMLSIVDYRAGFVRQDGVWRLRYFLAGD